MPFADEPLAHRVEVVPYQERSATEGEVLDARLALLVPSAVNIDHIGSTAVPGLPAKDCLDVMVRVPDVDHAGVDQLVKEGFRQRPEPWNTVETLDGVGYAKLVFAPPIGSRPVNVHVRQIGTAPARYALLFRDLLRADPTSRQVWGEFKLRLAETVSDKYDYGQIKASVQPLLMASAERWAAAHSWSPRPLPTPREGL
jgi:GrpB-like predicted nucleotidyltransferase (UPF0157 family)